MDPNFYVFVVKNTDDHDDVDVFQKSCEVILRIVSGLPQGINADPEPCGSGVSVVAPSSGGRQLQLMSCQEAEVLPFCVSLLRDCLMVRAQIAFQFNTKYRLRRFGVAFSVCASHVVGRVFVPQPGHTRDHYKNGTNCLPAWRSMR